MSPLRRLAGLCLAAVLSAGAGVSLTRCDPGLQQSTGLGAWMQVRGGRYIQGPFPTRENPDGSVAPDPDAAVGTVTPPPVIAVVQSANLLVRQRQRGKEFTGSASFNATTVAVGLDGDQGYWLVPMDAMDVDLPPNLTFHATVDLAADIPVGPRTLVFAAQDATGRVGPRRTLPLQVNSPLPDAPLAVALDWDRDVDLDLEVYLPDGTVLTHRGLRGPGGSNTPTTAAGPHIDVDSNANCQIDGIRQEIATFPTPMAGQYQVRVHLFSACSQPFTAWRVRVARGGTVAEAVHGSSYAQETNAPGGGPTDDGRLALTFTITL